MSFAEKLANVVNRHDEIQALLSSPDVSPDYLVRMNKEISELAPVVEAIHNYNRTENDLNDVKAMMEDDSLDKEMREMAAADPHPEVRAAAAATIDRLTLKAA